MWIVLTPIELPHHQVGRFCFGKQEAQICQKNLFIGGSPLKNR